MYATVEDVQAKLGITTLSDTKRSQIEKFLEWTAPEITAIIWNVMLGEKTEKINICDVCDSIPVEIYLKNIEVKSIKKINDKDYAWVIWTDYLIAQPQNRKVVIKDLFDYLDWNELEYFTITYISWFDKIPWDIVFAQVLLVEEEMNKSWWQTISQYKMWPRTIKYAWPWENNSSKNWFESYLNKYKILYI